MLIKHAATTTKKTKSMFFQTALAENYDDV